MELSLLELQVLLAIVSLQQDAFAGSILEEINRRTGHSHWHGTIYAALDRLEEQGFVRRTLQNKPSPKRGGKRKYICSLTLSGRATLKRSLNSIVPFAGAATRSMQRARRSA